jgi:ribonuclease HI
MEEDWDHLGIDWSRLEGSRKYPTQLIRTLASINTILPSGTLEPFSLEGTSPWFQKPPVDLFIASEDKKKASNTHQSLVKRLLREPNWKNALAYTDGSKMEGQTGAGLFTFIRNQEASQGWKLGPYLEVYDAELLAIAQAIRWGLEANLHLHQHLWIFADNQAAIQRIQNSSRQPGQHLVLDIYQGLQTLQDRGCQTHIHWVPGHQGIYGNEKADQAAKASLQNTSISRLSFTSYSYIKAEIKSQAIQEWNQDWSNNYQGQHYQQFNPRP